MSTNTVQKECKDGFGRDREKLEAPHYLPIKQISMFLLSGVRFLSSCSSFLAKKWKNSIGHYRTINLTR